MSKCLCAILFLGLALQTFAFGGVEELCQDCPEIMVQRQCVSAEPDTDTYEGVGLQCDAEACGVPLVVVPDPQGECGRQVESSSVTKELNVVNIVIESFELIKESEEDIKKAKDNHGLEAAHKLLAIIDGEGDVKDGIEMVQDDNSLVAVLTWEWKGTKLTMGGASLSINKIDDDGSILVKGIANDNVLYEIACLSSEEHCILASKDQRFSAWGVKRSLLQAIELANPVEDMDMSSKKGTADPCFPGSSLVQEQDRGLVRMDEIKMGDMVLAKDSRFEPVIQVPHPKNDGVLTYAVVETVSHTVRLTDAHLIYLEGARTPVRADSLEIGDAVVLAGGEPSTVLSLKMEVVPGGAYTLITPSGRIVVDGIVCSGYADNYDQIFYAIQNMMDRVMWSEATQHFITTGVFATADAVGIKVLMMQAVRMLVGATTY